MEALSIVPRGTETLNALELNGFSPEPKDGFVLFSPESYDDICDIAYSAHVSERIMLVLSRSPKGSLAALFSGIDFSEWLDSSTTIALRSINSSLEDKELAVLLFKSLNFQGFDPEVDLRNPDLSFVVLFDDKDCYLCIDFCGFDLNKRPYRIFMHRESLRSTLGAALCLFSGAGPKDIILDPFMGSGTIVIESCLLLSGLSSHFYSWDKFAFLKLKPLKGIKKLPASLDSKAALDITGSDLELRHVLSARKNAKIAGIDKKLKLTKCDIDWLDTKLNKNSVDLILTNPPVFSQRTSEKTRKIYKQLFYQAEFILKENGKIAIITSSRQEIIAAALPYKFRLEKELIVYSGKQKLYMLLFCSALA